MARKVRRTLLVLPTGTENRRILKDHRRSSQRRGEARVSARPQIRAIGSSSDKLHETFTGLGTAEKAESTSIGSWYRVVVGSVRHATGETFESQFPARLSFDVIVVDEAHHAISDGYQKVGYFKDSEVLGVTATPDRGDMKRARIVL